MTDTPSRRRAPAMSPDERRAMIVKAALPLVVEYGTSITTAQIARAAGIGEGTIFRAFGDKDAVLAACMAEALRLDDTLAHVDSISLELPLEERLIEAADAMRGYLARMGAVAGAMAASGQLRRNQDNPPAPGARDASMARSREALAALFEPDRETLRLDPDQLAGAFQYLMMTKVPTAELVDLFLHGAAR